MSREDFIYSIPNVSYINDDEAEKQNAKDLLSVMDEKYLFACDDVFTKIVESDDYVAWACEKSFYEISLYKDGSECYYGQASDIPRNIQYYE